MKRAIYPGSFDPVTLGHEDIIRRAAGMCDELIIAVGNNKAKNPLFSLDERVSMLKDVVESYDNVSVDTFDGLLVDFAAEKDAKIIVRGLRMISDFEFELQSAQTNSALNPQVETIFLCTNAAYSFLSSSAVRETGIFGGDVRGFVPEVVSDRVARKMREIYESK
ncbi:MAG: pantetheine-phosphate adenylyltransferase [Eubacterium sp.]|nr:pantetheine-phosphate adenylyltransferase [Eubacterium sp.]